MQVTCGSSRFSLLMMPSDDYPTLPTSPAPTGTIAGDVFTQAVAQVSIAADRGDTLPILTGVRVEIEGDKVTLLATDRYRLAMRELTWNPEATDASHVALVPARTLSDTAKALGASGSVEIALGSSAGGDGLIGFEAGQRRATTRLLDGEYPKVTSIFPSSVDTEAVDRDRRPGRGGQARRPGRRAQHPGPAEVHRGPGRDRGRHRRRRPGQRGRRGHAHRPRASRSPSTRSSCSTASARSARRTAGCRSPRASRPAVLSGQAEADGEADTSYRYVLMPVRFAS